MVNSHFSYLFLFVRFFPFHPTHKWWLASLCARFLKGCLCGCLVAVSRFWSAFSCVFSLLSVVRSVALFGLLWLVSSLSSPLCALVRSPALWRCGAPLRCRSVLSVFALFCLFFSFFFRFLPFFVAFFLACFVLFSYL